MTIKVGDKVPSATFMQMQEGGPKPVSSDELFAGKTVALFALARTVGWIAQWKEMIEDPHQKIGRPRQLYTGVKERNYVPVNKRT